MLKNYQKNPKDSFSAKYADSYHCHFALENLLNNLLKINYLGITDYQYHSSRMAVKMDGTYHFRLPLPITGKDLKEFSTSIHRFTTARESTLYEVLFENTNLIKLKKNHCIFCPQTDTCKAFIMSNKMDDELDK